MTKLIFADPHWSDNPRDRYRHDFVDWMVAQIRKRQASDVYLLGDLTVEKNYHDAWLVNRCVDHVYRLAQEARVTIDQGNHDYTNQDNPFFEFLNRVPNVTWISTPTVIENYLFLPHTRQWKADWHEISIQAHNYDCVFAHQTFEGAAVGGRPLGGIPIEAIGWCRRVISGDIHHPQKILISGGGYLHYVGAPYRVNFGDDYAPRILMLDEADKLTSISVPGVRKQLLDIDASTNMDQACTDLDAGDILKIRIKIGRETYDHWPAIKAKVRQWADKHDYIVDSIHPILEAVARVTPSRREDNKTDVELVRTYAKKVGATPDTLTAGLQLLDGT
jgi:hypothetical protein